MIGKFSGQKGYYDTVILGCTHYEFVKNKILDHFCPKNLISGTEYTVKNVSKYIPMLKTSVNYKQFDVLFVGKYAKFNEEFYKKVVKTP